MKKWLIGIGVVVVLGALIALNLRSKGGPRHEVTVAEVIKRDLKRVITASGNIQPRRQVNVSATAMGRVTRLAVREGQRVEKGDFLLEIDPTTYATAVAQQAAAVRGAEATLELEQATLRKAEVDYERARDLHAKGFASETELRNARVGVEISAAKVKAARESLSQYRASLEKVRHDLDEVSITAEMSGVITALNVEEGESAIMGTLNNPGTVLLTIADLSEIEAEVQVDETEVVDIRVGQAARVRLDAFPDTTFSGEVVEVGNSAIRRSLGLGQESVDFKVVIRITEALPDVRPGLSASVDIEVATASGVWTVPIQSLTVRDPSRLTRERRRGANKEDEDATGSDTSEASDDTDEQSEKRDVEGVFIVKDGRAMFQQVRVGIAGASHFEIGSGLAGGESVVTGPFRAINELRHEERVKVTTQKGRGTD